MTQTAARPQTPGLLLQMRDIGKSFPGVRALEGVSFELRPGEVHVLLGENGAGKSTLMKILSGACRPDTGSIQVEGTPVAIGSPRIAQRLGINTIYQEFNLVPQLSVAHNIYLGRERAFGPGFLDRRALEEQAATLLRQLSIDLRPAAAVASLSVAQQQMVEVARALAFDSRILIMDEPTSALTNAEIQTLFALIRRIRDRGVGVIYISHRMEEIFAIGDRVTVLRDGRQIGTRLVGAVTVDELVHLMAGRELKEHFPRTAVAPGRPLLEARHVCAGSRLRDVSLVLRAGEVLGVAGLLGSGRSTLGRVLFGAQRATGGTILVRGREVNTHSPAAAIRNGIGYLSEDRQRSGLVLTLSVRQNITLPNTDTLYRLGIVNAARERQVAERYVAQLGIKTPHTGQPVIHLSGGNQQKVVLSKWLAREAGILIFDEPTRGIDVAAKVDIYELMSRLKEQGVGILMISSDLPEVLGLSDRILVLHNGAVAAEFPRGAADQERVLRAALGEPA